MKPCRRCPCERVATRENHRSSLEARLLNETTDLQVDEDPSLVDGVNLMAEQFEARHPTLASTLRSVMQSLADMGI